MTDTPATAAKPAKAKTVELIGSDNLGAVLSVGDQTIPNVDLAKATQTMSGLSVEDWNALTQDDRDKRMTGVLNAQRDAWASARGSAANYRIDPLNPELVTVRVTQAMTIPPSPEQKAKGVEAVDFRVGSNVVPRWAAENEMVQDNLER